MSRLDRPGPWWAATLLSPPLLVLAERWLPSSPVLPASVRLGFLLALLVFLPWAFGSAALRRARATGDAPDPQVVHALQEVAQARQSIQETLAALARAGPQASSAPAPAPAKTRRALPIAIALAVFLLASGGLAVAFLQVPDENIPSATNPFHIHATFAVYVRGERVNYSDPGFDLASRGFLVSHLHVPDQDLLHLEGRPGQTLGEALERATGTLLSDGKLTLDGITHGGMAYSDSGAERVRVLVAHDLGDDWNEVPEGAAYKLRDGDRVLITYGSLDETALDEQKDSVARRKQ